MFYTKLVDVYKTSYSFVGGFFWKILTHIKDHIGQICKSNRTKHDGQKWLLFKPPNSFDDWMTRSSPAWKLAGLVSPSSIRLWPPGFRELCPFTICCTTSVSHGFVSYRQTPKSGYIGCQLSDFWPQQVRWICLFKSHGRYVAISSWS